MKYEIEMIIGGVRRGVAFLLSGGDKRVNAKEAFNSLLEEKNKKFLKAVCEAWKDGLKNQNYHGWGKSQFEGKYIDCFSFEVRVKRVEHRFYGFLYHPYNENPSYELCVLAVHATKNTHETEEINLKHVVELNSMPAIIKAVDDFFKVKK